LDTVNKQLREDLEKAIQQIKVYQKQLNDQSKSNTNLRQWIRQLEAGAKGISVPGAQVLEKNEKELIVEKVLEEEFMVYP
jgi:hypothetical protein